VGEIGPISTKITQLAARQHGHVTRRQLLDLGLGSEAIDYRRSAGELISVHAGVYAVGYPRVEPVARAAAAVLACGHGAVLSHASAAALWGLGRWPDMPEVTSRSDHRQLGIWMHRTRSLRRDEIRMRLGIWVTSAGRTTGDIAPRLTDKQLTRAVQEARLNHHLKPTALDQLGRRCRRIQQLVDPDQNPTRSGLEDEFLRWIRRHKLPMPTINVKADGMEVDAKFTTERVILEVDSWEYHGDPITFRSDAERGTAHAANDFLPLRLTSDRLTAAEAERLHGILARRR
jgi:hypothetical protein